MVTIAPSRYSKEAFAMAAKTIQGHKGWVTFGVHYSCECGWRGTDHYGKGARSGAAYEFQDHKRKHLVEEGKLS